MRGTIVGAATGLTLAAGVLAGPAALPAAAAEAPRAQAASTEVAAAPGWVFYQHYITRTSCAQNGISLTRAYPTFYGAWLCEQGGGFWELYLYRLR